MDQRLEQRFAEAGSRHLLLIYSFIPLCEVLVWSPVERLCNSLAGFWAVYFPSIKFLYLEKQPAAISQWE